MNELNTIITEATAAIDEMYFQLNIDGGGPIYRERVYCYELYHQMRTRWPEGVSYYLNGEIDKSAHPILKELGADNTKPDFLIHQPGYMTGNHAIVEVKHVAAQQQGILKDLSTLSTFINKVNYERAIYLFYGYEDPDTIINRVQESIGRADFKLAQIELWVHNNVNSAAQHVHTFNA